LDECIIVLQEVLGQPLGIKTEKLYELSKFVEEVTRFPVPPTNPLVGRQAFTYKFDTHLEAVLKSVSAFQAINPQIVGRNIEMALGTTSGSFAVRAKANELGIKLDERKVDEIVALVRHKALELRRALTDGEFRDIIS
jgi:isopropylmalate/homocitrate/citramalate synthase